MSIGALSAAVEPILNRAIRDRVFPGAVIEVGRTNGPLLTVVSGAQTYEETSPSVNAHTIYDLASLTKVLATTALVAGEVSTGRMRIDDPIRHWIPAWTGADRQHLTIRDLLEHASGLPGHRRYFETRHGRAAFETAICEEPLEYRPRTASIYSDPGFMLLGFALEHAAGASLDRRFDAWRDRELGSDCEVRFLPDASWGARIAPTEIDSSGRPRRGEVHDENAAALGGVAAHAGLFGTVAAVGACARWWMRSTALSVFSRKTTVPGSSRALGWDTMLPTSSCGTRMSASAVGHTGFTGTSLWIDAANDLYVAILSNRVHPTRNGEGIQEVRRAIHDAILTALQAGEADRARSGSFRLDR